MMSLKSGLINKVGWSWQLQGANLNSCSNLRKINPIGWMPFFKAGSKAGLDFPIENKTPFSSQKLKKSILLTDIISILVT